MHLINICYKMFHAKIGIQNKFSLITFSKIVVKIFIELNIITGVYPSKIIDLLSSSLILGALSIHNLLSHSIGSQTIYL